MRIAELRPDKKHLIKITLDTGDCKWLDRDVVFDHALREDTYLTEETLDELLFESDYTRAKSRALWYLDRGDRTEKGLYRKLTEAGFDKHACAAVIARLKELELLDDRRFAENFAARCAQSNISRRETVRKLLEKGVPYDIAKEAAAETNADEEEQIRTLICKKYAARLCGENGVQKVYGALARKGFSFDAIKTVLKQYNQELEYSEE